MKTIASWIVNILFERCFGLFEPREDGNKGRKRNADSKVLVAIHDQRTKAEKAKVAKERKHFSTMLSCTYGVKENHIVATMRHVEDGFIRERER